MRWGSADGNHAGAVTIDGFFSAKSWIKHHAQLTGSEAHGRLQVMRMFDLLPVWAAAARSGEVGVAQTRLMAAVAANPRVQLALTECVELLLADAVVLSFEEFERRVRDFERSADQDGAATRARKHHERRDAGLRQGKDGAWWLWARFGSLQGAQVNEVLAYFIQAEWDADWAEARARCGEGVGMTDLRRAEPQRRATARRRCRR